MIRVRKSSLIIALVLCCAIIFVACGGTTVQQNSTSGEKNVAVETKKETPKEKKKIKFYGKIVEYSSGEAMCNELAAQLKDEYNFDFIQVDWGNLEKVIRTGIASGEPADIYQYWPQSMRTFVKSDMALDLTPYLEANGGEWKKQFISASLESGNIDGKYYAVPMDSNFSTIIANTEVFEKAGVTIPEKWTWEEFIAACKQLKEKGGVIPFGNGMDNARGGWIFVNGIMSLAKSSDKLTDYAAFKLPGNDPLYKTCLTNIKGLYDAGYMYPGKGAVTIKSDEVKAGFVQGKVAMIADIAAGAAGTIKDAKFKTAIAPWPAMGTKNAVIGGCDGLFIPANAKNKEDAVKILKVYTGEKVQKIHADAGYAVANANVAVNDPITKAIIKASEDVAPVTADNAKFVEYYNKQVVPDLVLGKGVDSVMAAIEAFRTAK